METGEMKPPYTAVALRHGWEFRSPAGRWEKVVEVDDQPGSYFTRVWTNKSGSFGWLLPSSRSIHAVPPRASEEPILLRLLDPGRAASPRMSIILAYADAEFPWSDFEEMPAVASYGGRGLGWMIQYRPNGVDDLVEQKFVDKLGAKRRMNAIMRGYSETLGIRVGPEMGG